MTSGGGDDERVRRELASICAVPSATRATAAPRRWPERRRSGRGGGRHRAESRALAAKVAATATAIGSTLVTKFNARPSPSALAWTCAPVFARIHVPSGSWDRPRAARPATDLRSRVRKIPRSLRFIGGRIRRHRLTRQAPRCLPSFAPSPARIGENHFRWGRPGARTASPPPTERGRPSARARRARAQRTAAIRSASSSERPLGRVAARRPAMSDESVQPVPCTPGIARRARAIRSTRPLASASQSIAVAPPPCPPFTSTARAPSSSSATAASRASRVVDGAWLRRAGRGRLGAVRRDQRRRAVSERVRRERAASVEAETLSPATATEA